MKLLNIFNQYLEPGGEASAVDAICNSLSQILEIQRCDFFSADWAGPNAPPLFKQALWMIRNPATVQRIREYQRGFRADAWLVHNIFPVASGAIHSEARKIGVPVIQYIHNFRPFSISGYLWAGDQIATGGLSKNYWKEIRCGAWQDSRIKSAWMALVLILGHSAGWWRNVKAWIAISEFMKQKFIEGGIPAERIFTLRHFWKPKQDANPTSGEYYIFLGRLTEAKGINVLLDAWEILERDYKRDAPRLVICGDGPLRQAVAMRALRMQSVDFQGLLGGTAKAQAIQGARAVIVPSISWEALGLVVYEAYDSSKAVLVARSGGLPEIVVEGKTGLIHNPGDTAQLAKDVIHLENEPWKREEMGRNGREWLLANADELAWQRKFCEIARVVTEAERV